MSTFGKEELSGGGVAFRQLSLLVERNRPGSRLVAVRPFAIDAATHTDTEKGVGYGKPLKLETQRADGAPETYVFHTASENLFGHQRRADRAADMLLAFDTMPQIPQHALALDVGAISADRTDFVSLRKTGEFYLLTRYAPGHPYADELRAMVRRGQVEPKDLSHCASLAGYLATLHQPLNDRLGLYRRSVRDLVGSGEGIMGIIDGYPEDVPQELRRRLQSIETQCQEWRWKLRSKESRLVRSHGDFHPFNILFDEDTITVLDASRGCVGDAADDVACLSINYLFFGWQCDRACRRDFLRLFSLFFDEYLSCTDDQEILSTLTPYFAWRGLVLASPVWYPRLDPDTREAILNFVERCLGAEHFDPAFAREALG